MRIAHLLRKYDPAEWGGTETAILQLCDGLRREGVESVVYCPQIASGGSADPLAAAGVVVRRFRACVPIWGLSPEQRRQMVAVGGNLMSFDLLRALWLTPLSAIHPHTLGRVGGIGLTIARRRRVPFVVTIHGGVYDLPEPMRKAFNTPQHRGWEWGKPFGLLLRARHVLAEADAIVTCNAREAALVAERHPGRRVVVQPHGVPAERYALDQRAAARSAFPEIDGREVLLSVGRIDGVKNQGWLVEQLPEVLRRHPRVLLVLAGACTDEAYGEALRRRIAALGLEKHVLLTGKLPPADPRLIGLLQVARAALLASISETFGLVILEAWAAGTPAVSSRTSGASALIEHGNNGLLFDLERPEKFHAAVDIALRGGETCTTLVNAGRSRVAADFDTRVLARRLQQLYHQLREERNALRHHP
jgi:glycosyltransferase involved in cell wall biosynthesis